MTDIKNDNKLIKQVLKGNPEILKAVNALFLGFELTKDEKELVKSTFSNEELYNAFEKRITPRLRKDAPIGQQSDEWAGLEEQIYGAHTDQIYQAVHYKKRAIEIAKQAMALLKDPDGTPINLNFDPESSVSDPLQIQLLARNMYIKMVQNQLSTIWLIAEMKEDESPQDAAKRLMQDSSK